MSGFQLAITIQQAIESIKNKEYLLPAFQREFVWLSEQIEKLFDSVMQGYPISSMLFWKVKGETKTNFKFYEFLNQFVERYNTHNDHIKSDNLNNFHAVLDGQQRLTALYIGLCGTYAYHLYNHSWENSERSFLLNSVTQEKDLVEIEDKKWFKVGRILSLHKSTEYELDDFIEDNDLDKLSRKIIRILNRAMHNDRTINYYEEDY